MTVWCKKKAINKKRFRFLASASQYVWECEHGINAGGNSCSTVRLQVCVPGLNRHNHVFPWTKVNMIVNIKLSTKQLHKFLYKTKTCLENVFKKSHPFTKGSVGACMQILNLTIQHHTTAKDKNLHMCYKNIILGEKNSIASSHSSKLSVSVDLFRSYGWYNAKLSANLPFYSSFMDLVLRGSLVFKCSYLTPSVLGEMLQ